MRKRNVSEWSHKILRKCHKRFWGIKSLWEKSITFTRIKSLNFEKILFFSEWSRYESQKFKRILSLNYEKML